MAQRVLLVNKFFYPRGGDCIVTMGLHTLLQANGMETEVFAMRYPVNEPLPEQDGWATEVDFAGSMGDKLRAVRRVMGGGGVKEAFAKVLDRFKPDAVWFHNIHSHLSPAIVRMAHDRGIRVLWTMHDYKLVCPAYLCQDSMGRPCTKCVGGSPLHAVAGRCMKGSLLNSAVGAAEALRWRPGKLARWVDAFVCPSAFMADMLVRGGVPHERTTVLPNFIDPAKLAVLNDGSECRRGDNVVYIGRLSREKGVETLLEAFAKRDTRLDLYGTGPLAETLRTRYAGSPNIRFHGHADARTVANALRTAAASVMPSECFDNNPLAVIESLCAGTPVIGARNGGIPELIGEGDGIVFAPGSVTELLAATDAALGTAWDYAAIASRAVARFSASALTPRILSLLGAD